MKRFIWVVIPALTLCVANGPQSFAGQSSLQTECKNGLAEAKGEINAMSDPAKKQQAQKLGKEASTDGKSGEFQKCLDKLKQIKTLTH